MIAIFLILDFIKKMDREIELHYLSEDEGEIQLEDIPNEHLLQTKDVESPPIYLIILEIIVALLLPWLLPLLLQ